ncbi:CENP-V/GFA domain [Dillenia turbinata]|uniref:CENP-V/GFA domain n=1 Tax=Dillenia turbinata TaxID=194707 RepID=A0AAN8VEH0_9MAGN
MDRSEATFSYMCAYGSPEFLFCVGLCLFTFNIQESSNSLSLWRGLCLYYFAFAMSLCANLEAVGLASLLFYQNSGSSFTLERSIYLLVSVPSIVSWMDSNLVVHKGGCHCKRVRWQVQAPASVVAWNCNCSDCSMRGNTQIIVPSKRFELLGDSSQFLTTYTFGTHTAKHKFCKVCGITSFYIPRSNPDGVAVTFRCVDPGTLAHVEIKQFDGKNWEASYKDTGIASQSKLEN